MTKTIAMAKITLSVTNKMKVAGENSSGDGPPRDDTGLKTYMYIIKWYIIIFIKIYVIAMATITVGV